MPRRVRQMTAAIASGDPEAFSALYRQCFDFMYAAARRDTQGDEQFCLDVVQDAMMRVMRRIKPMNDEAALQAWLRTVVKSAAYDQLRRRNRLLKRERAAAVERSEVSQPQQEHLVQEEWLRQQLCRLHPEQAHLLSLRFRFGWTLQRIGAALGLKAGAVDGRLTRAIENLRQRAKEDFNDE